MKSYPKINATLVVVIGLSTIALAAGCSSSKSQTTRTTPAPVYSASGYSVTREPNDVPIYTARYGEAETTAAGAPGSGTETQTGAGAQGQGGTTVIPLYKEEIVVGTRQVPAGTVRLRKSVKTETFNQPVQLRHETLSVNQTTPGAADTNAQPSLEPTGRTEAGSQQPGKTFQDQDIVIQLYREEPVVQKKIVPAGQIEAQKHLQTQQMNIQDQVRREEIQITKSGEATNVNVAPNLQSKMQGEEQPTAVGTPPSGQEETSGSGTESGDDTEEP